MEVDYKVGDTVRVKYCKNHKVFIIEITEQLCYANVRQVWYTGRVFNNGTKMGDNFLNKEYSRFSAIELEPLPIPSAKLAELVKKCKEEIKAKTDFIVEQDFEKAASHRDAECELRRQIETLSEIECIMMGDLDL